MKLVVMIGDDTFEYRAGDLDALLDELDAADTLGWPVAFLVDGVELDPGAFGDLILFDELLEPVGIKGIDA
jgi:hypothetical protein